MRKLLILWLSLFLLLLVSEGCTGLNEEKRTIKIGLVGPFSGADSLLGYDALFGAKLAINQRNDAGGIGGHGILLVSYDDQDGSEWGESAAKKMIVDPDVKGVIGHSEDESALAAIDYYHSAGLALITTGATSNDLTTKGYSEVFRLVANDTVLAKQMVTYAAGQGNSSRMAFVAEPITGAVKLADTIYSNLPAKATFVFGEPFRSQQTDFRDIARRVKSASPDFVFYTGSPVFGAPFWMEAKNAGIKAKLVLGPSAANPNFVKIAKDSANDVYFVSLGPYPTTIPEASQMVEGYKALAGVDPLSMAGLTYDATNLLLDAMQKDFDSEGKVERAAVVSTLHDSDFNGITGEIAFGENGERINPQVYIYHFEGKDFPGKRVN